jgi:dihydrofolate reductase
MNKSVSSRRLTLIWAQANHGAIGRQNALPWHVPADFAHFKAVTAGKPVLMGRKTWESLPRKPLPGRLNLVVSSQPLDLEGGALSFLTVEDALAYCKDAEEVVCIGGASLYIQLLPLATQVWVSELAIDIPDADAYAPSLNPQEWLEAESKLLPDDKIQAVARRFVRA